MCYFPPQECFVLQGGWCDPDWIPRSNTWELRVREHHPIVLDRLLYVSNSGTSNETFEIYTQRLGEPPRRITNNQDTEWGPALGPDGHSIAYVDIGSNAAPNIYVTNLDGDPPTSVSNTVKALAVQWRDPSTLIYLGEVANSFTPQYQVRRVGTSGAPDTRHYNDTFQTWRLGTDTFHVDRQHGQICIATFSGTNNTSRLVSGPIDGSGTNYQRQADAAMNDLYHPRRSPDGRWGAYSGDTGLGMGDGPGYHKVYVGGWENTGGDIAVSDNFCGNPDWSSDGLWLAYVRASNSTWGTGPYIGDIWRVGYNGEGRVPVTAHYPQVARGSACPSVYQEPQSYEITEVRRYGDYSDLTVESTDGAIYVLNEYSNLDDTTPYAVFSNIAGIAGTFSCTGITSKATRRFYRIGGTPRPLPPPP